MGQAGVHPNELLVDEGLLAAAQFLVSGDPSAEEILDGVSVHLIPRIVPGGFVARQRYNIDTAAPEGNTVDEVLTTFDRTPELQPDPTLDDIDDGIERASAGIFADPEPGVGWNVNWYFRYDWTEHILYQNFPDEYPENPCPEARTVIEMVEDVDPEWIVDFHRQSDYEVDHEATYDPETDEEGDPDDPDEYPPDPDDPGDGDYVTGSLFWPVNPNVSPEVQDLSKQVVMTMYDELTKLDRAIYSRYPGGTFGGISRNGHGLAGRGSVLFEVSGGTLGDREFRLRQAFMGILAAAKATADGSLYEMNPDRVEELPERSGGFNM